MAEDGKLKFLIDTKLLEGNLAQIRNYIWEGEEAVQGIEQCKGQWHAGICNKQQAHSWFNS